jgi:hypothetical protein
VKESDDSTKNNDTKLLLAVHLGDHQCRYNGFATKQVHELDTKESASARGEYHKRHWRQTEGFVNSGAMGDTNVM